MIIIILDEDTAEIEQKVIILESNTAIIVSFLYKKLEYLSLMPRMIDLSPIASFNYHRLLVQLT